MKRFGFTRMAKPSNVVFDRVERTNAPEWLMHALRLCGLGRDEVASRVTPTLSLHNADFFA
jgi:hypothetical protein